MAKYHWNQFTGSWSLESWSKGARACFFIYKPYSRFLRIVWTDTLLPSKEVNFIMGGEVKSLWDRTRSTPPSYQQLPEDFDAQTYSSTPRSSKSKRCKMFLSSFLVAAVIVSAGVYFVITSFRAAKLKSVDMLTCGTTNEEAISRGCIMEPMVYGWMPEPCYFPEQTVSRGTLSVLVEKTSDGGWTEERVAWP